MIRENYYFIDETNDTEYGNSLYDKHGFLIDHKKFSDDLSEACLGALQIVAGLLLGILAFAVFAVGKNFLK